MIDYEPDWNQWCFEEFDLLFVRQGAVTSYNLHGLTTMQKVGSGEINRIVRPILYIHVLRADPDVTP